MCLHLARKKAGEDSPSEKHHRREAVIGLADKKLNIKLMTRKHMAGSRIRERITRITRTTAALPRALALGGKN